MISLANIPTEILYCIIVPYNVREMWNIMIVNKDTKTRIADNPEFWKRKFLKDYEGFKQTAKVAIKPDIDWKIQYRDTTAIFKVREKDYPYYRVPNPSNKPWNVIFDESLKKFVKISTSSTHTLALSYSGQVYIKKNHVRQTINGPPKSYFGLGGDVNKLDVHCKKYTRIYNVQNPDTSIKSTLHDFIAKDIVAGDGFSIFIGDDDYIWFTGDNENYHAGQKISKTSFYIPVRTTYKAKKIYANSKKLLYIGLDNKVCCNGICPKQFGFNVFNGNAVGGLNKWILDSYKFPHINPKYITLDEHDDNIIDKDNRLYLYHTNCMGKPDYMLENLFRINKHFITINNYYLQHSMNNYIIIHNKNTQNSCILVDSNFQKIKCSKILHHHKTLYILDVNGVLFMILVNDKLTESNALIAYKMLGLNKSIRDIFIDEDGIIALV